MWASILAVIGEVEALEPAGIAAFNELKALVSSPAAQQIEAAASKLLHFTTTPTAAAVTVTSK